MFVCYLSTTNCLESEGSDNEDGTLEVKHG